MLAEKEQLAISCWKAGEREQSGQFYREIINDAVNNTELRKEIENDYIRFEHNISFYPELNQDQGPPKSSPLENTQPLSRTCISESTRPLERTRTLAIIGYKTTIIKPWGPASIQTGLPGSEEAVVYCSQILAKEGWKVDIWANPPKNSIHKLKLINPRYYDVDDLKSLDEGRKLAVDLKSLGDLKEEDNRYDVVIMWRRFDFNTGAKYGKKVFLWIHDSPTWSVNNIENLDGVFFLTEHHRKQFLAYGGSIGMVPYVISGNGILLDQFPESMSLNANKPNRLACGYYSNYARGLKVLLEMWPRIHTAYPGATLDVYHGRETWGLLSEEQMNEMDKIFKQLKNQGVTECGRVGHEDLTAAMGHHSIWTYPNNTEAETFCITATRAQMAGLIPVTSRVGALAETVEPSAAGTNRMSGPTDVRDYEIALLQTMKKVVSMSEENLQKERDKYRKFASTYTWERCVKKWQELKWE